MKKKFWNKFKAEIITIFALLFLTLSAIKLYPNAAAFFVGENMKVYADECHTQVYIDYPERKYRVYELYETIDIYGTKNYLRTGKVYNLNLPAEKVLLKLPGWKQ